MSDIQTSGDGKKITVLKVEFCLEHYLFDVINSNHGNSFSSHNHGIETGRHPKPPKPKEQRLCLCCTNACVDDEIHFLTECDIHTETRQRFIDN